MTCWPCSSASTLRIDASGPGGSPLIGRGDRAQADEAQDLGLDVERGEPLAERRIGDAALRAHEVEQVAGGGPHAPQRAALDSDTRSLPSVTLASAQPSFSSPTRFSAGRRTSVKNTSLNVWHAGHLDDRADLDAGRVHRADEVRDALVLGRVGVGAGDEDAEAGDVGERRPDLLAVDDVDVAVAHGPGAEVGQVAARAGLAEQLAPDLLAAEQREQVAVLLRLRAGVEDRRTGPADADRVLTGRRTPARRSSSSMISWWIGSASRPHGLGQCGAT